MVTKYRADAQSVSMFSDDTPGLHALTHVDDQPDQSAVLGPDVNVRPYCLRDSVGMNQLPFRYELHHPESDSDRPSLVRLVVRRMLAGLTINRPQFVAVADPGGTCLGTLQCQQEGADDRWTLHYLALSGAIDSSDTATIALLEHAISAAGWCGARRVMAKSPEDSHLTRLLRRTGFTGFTREHIYTAQHTLPGEPGQHVRTQENSDVWGIHQLYLQTTPRDVQNAEALTSHEWDTDTEGRSRRGWFIATDGTPTAYIRVRTTRRHHRLDLMFVPGAQSLVPELLNAVLSVLFHETPRPIYVAVRGYQQEIDTVLLSAGFVPEIEQLIMVRYTTVPVPARANEGFELLRAAESDPRRVPSFCKGGDA